MEHRHRERKNLFIYLDVVKPQTGDLIGQLGDISNDGLMLICDHPLPMKQMMNIRIKLPDDEDFPQESLDLTVETRWTSPDTNPELHCNGCRFVNASSQDVAMAVQIGELLSFGG